MLQSYAGVILEKIDKKCNEILLFAEGKGKKGGFIVDLQRGFSFHSSGPSSQIDGGQVGIRKRKILFTPLLERVHAC